MITLDDILKLHDDGYKYIQARSEEDMIVLEDIAKKLIELGYNIDFDENNRENMTGKRYLRSFRFV